MIDPGFWGSEDVSKLNITERLFLIGLFSNADDHGKGRASSAYLRSIIFPYDDISIDKIEKAIENIQKYINIEFYQVSGSRYYKFTKWCNWQRVDKPQTSQLPDYSESENDSKNDSENDSCLKEKKGKEEEYSAFFESIWQLYPNKKGKASVSNTQKAKLCTIGIDKITKCIDRYKEAKPEWQAWKNGSTFFNSGYVDYLDENYTEEKAQRKGTVILE